MASVARWCCCGCGGSRDVTLADIDAAKCGSCENNGFNSSRVDTLDVDGTYAVSLVSEAALTCSYGGTFSPGTSDASQWGPSLNTTCSGAAQYSGADSLSITFTLVKATGKITNLDATIQVPDGIGGTVSFKVFSNTGSFDIGTSASNTLTCGYLVASNGGTFQVD